MNKLLFNNQELLVDGEGYLINVNQWSPELATFLANENNIQLTDQHWLVINFVRNFYFEYKTTPAIRVLVNKLKKEFGEEIGNSRNLQRMFNDSPAKTIAKLAGLSKPAKCL